MMKPLRIMDALEGLHIEKADAEVLLAAVLGKGRTWLFAHADTSLDEEQRQRFSQWVKRRASHEPIAYITGTKEFFGRPFTVNTHTLIPRPSTEGLVELALEMLDENSSGPIIHAVDTDIIAFGEGKFASHRPNLIVDVGTGSGCIAVTIALERPGERLLATDISTQALEVARNNAKNHHVEDQITFAQGSLLEPLQAITEPFFLISNPPYIPENEELVFDVAGYEPHGALFGGTEGLDLLLPLVRHARMHPLCSGFLMECRADQIDRLS